MEESFKTALVLGTGKSGLAALSFLRSEHIRTYIYDGSSEEKDVHRRLKEQGTEVFLGTVPDFDALKIDFAVISPGIPPHRDACASALLDAGIPLWGELELASRFISRPIIGITGTNGKTTTTTLVGEMFKAAGLKAFVGGNIGIPLLESLKGDYDFYIVEMSSYQLETVCTLNARVGVYLNLTPDHQDRHGSMEGYLDAKANMCRLQDKTGFTVLNAADDYISSLKDVAAGGIVWFSTEGPVERGAFADAGGNIVWRPAADKKQDRVLMPVEDLRLPGKHNLENALAAIAAAELMQVPEDAITGTLRSFAGVEHRMEDVRILEGVRYVNDSKGTNPDSVFKALASYGDTPIVLIAGGRNKGNCFDDLGKDIAKKCRSLVLIGEAAEDMKNSALKAGMKDTDIIMAGDMEHAVKAAAAVARSGDIVLLSPANASFDQFNSFEHRGEVFKALVNAL